MARRVVAADDGRSRRFSLRSPSSGLTIIRDGATIACQTHLTANLARRSGRGRGVMGVVVPEGGVARARRCAGERVGGRGMRRAVLRRGASCRVGDAVSGRAVRARRRIGSHRAEGLHLGRPGDTPRGRGAMRGMPRWVALYRGTPYQGGSGYRARDASYRGVAPGTAPAPRHSASPARRIQTHAGRQPVRRRPACLRAPVRPR